MSLMVERSLDETLRAGECALNADCRRDHRAHRTGNGAHRVQGDGRAAIEWTDVWAASTTRCVAAPWRCMRCAASRALQRLSFLPRDPHDPDAPGRAPMRRGNFRPPHPIRSDSRRINCRKTISTSSTRRTRRCRRPPLGFPTRPEDLVIDEFGKPLRIDKPIPGKCRSPRMV